LTIKCGIASCEEKLHVSDKVLEHLDEYYSVHTHEEIGAGEEFVEDLAATDKPVRIVVALSAEDGCYEAVVASLFESRDVR
jgi:hypothetical protein